MLKQHVFKIQLYLPLDC